LARIKTRHNSPLIIKLDFESDTLYYPVWKNDFQTHLFVFGDKEIFALDVFESKKEALKASDGIKHLKVIPCTIIYKQ